MNTIFMIIFMQRKFVMQQQGNYLLCDACNYKLFLATLHDYYIFI